MWTVFSLELLCVTVSIITFFAFTLSFAPIPYHTVKNVYGIPGFFYQNFLILEKTMLTRDFSCHSKKGFFVSWGGKSVTVMLGYFFPGWEMFYFPKDAIQENELSKILEEFPAAEEEYPGKLLPANINTNWFKKGFCENSRLGEGISGETPCFIRETNSRIERVWD